MAKLDTREPVVAAFEIGEGVVQLPRADRLGSAEVELAALHRRSAHRHAALVGVQDGLPWGAENDRVHGVRADRQIGMHAAAVGTGLAADVGRRRRHAETFVGEGVLDAEPERERIAGLRTQRVLDDSAVRFALAHRPGDPAHETVDRVLGLGLVERELMPPPPELVPAVLDPVRPRDEHLAAAGSRDLVGGVAIEQVEASDRVRAQPAADLDHHDTLLARGDLDLLTGGKRTVRHAAGRPSRRSPTRSEFAIAVNAGLAAPIDGGTPPTRSLTDIGARSRRIRCRTNTGTRTFSRAGAAPAERSAPL